MDTFLQPSATIRGSLLIKTTSLQKPAVVGFYSSEKLSETDTKIRLDASHCKYFRRQLLMKENCRIDLKLYEDKRKEYESEHSEYSPHHVPILVFLDYLEEFVTQDRFTKCSANKLFDADIICDAKVLIKMMMVPGNITEAFSLLCTKFKGNIYIKRQTKSHEYRNESLKIIASYALYADNPNTDINTNVPGLTKFHCVFNWKLRDLSFMYFSGVQGVDSDAEMISATTDLSELKVSRIKTRFSHTDERVHAMYQSPFWWSQSLLLRNDEIHVANISDEDVIENIETIGIEAFLHKYEKKWKKSGSDRVSFLSLMMELIKLRMTFVNCPLTVYEFRFNPKIQQTVHYQIHTGRNEFTFLTDKYVNAVKDL